jgi:hypothetical protein
LPGGAASQPRRKREARNMRAPTEVRPEELREAHDAADTLISERFRSYLPGRMLPMLLGRFRDDAESLGMELPPLPRRSGPVKVVKLDDLTSSELGTLSGAVLVLVTRFTALMDDPLLPELLREFRDALVIEQADRTRIADELRGKARTS